MKNVPSRRINPFLLLALLTWANCIAFQAAAQSASEVPSARQVLDTFDPLRPGRGPDLFTPDTLDHAMAYGLYASAAALLGDAKQSKVAADWLAANARAASGAVGWGLPFEFDAFADKSVNPISTVYGITVAICVAGLLDAGALTGEGRYKETAVAALNYYKQFFTETQSGGYFWYSDQPSDDIEALNVTAMLAGQYARAGVLFGRPDFVDIARKGVLYVWSRRSQSDFGDYWGYSSATFKPNDDAHAAYIVQGLLDYSKATGSTEYDLTEAIRYLGAFTNDSGVSRFVPHPNLSPELVELPALLWGVGMLIYTLADAGDVEGASKAAQQIFRYRFAENGFGVLPGRTVNYPRFNGHLALGLARLEAADRK